MTIEEKTRILKLHDFDKLRTHLGMTKKNHIDYLSYIENKINTSNSFLSLKKNINFAFFSKEESKINEIGNKFKDIQYIDSDIDFI